MNQLDQFDIVRAYVKTRKTWPLKPGAEKLDGLTGLFDVAWRIEPGEKQDRYPGEWALMPADEATMSAFRAVGITWIASGDVVPVGFYGSTAPRP